MSAAGRFCAAMTLLGATTDSRLGRVQLTAESGLAFGCEFVADRQRPARGPAGERRGQSPPSEGRALSALLLAGRWCRGWRRQESSKRALLYRYPPKMSTNVVTIACATINRGSTKEVASVERIKVQQSPNPNISPGAKSLGGAHPTRSAAARWGGNQELFNDGFVVVPPVPPPLRIAQSRTHIW